MEVGVLVWYKCGEEWLQAEITSKTADSVVVTVEDTSTSHTIATQDEDDELEELKLCNDRFNESVDDMITLPYLHEPALLHCLEKRYREGDIYTYTGPILIAVNPFKRLDIYGAHELASYYNIGLLRSQGLESASSLPPHVFAIADSAYHSMIGAIGTDMSLGGDDEFVSGNQSILISGESGAGKKMSSSYIRCDVSITIMMNLLLQGKRSRQNLF